MRNSGVDWRAARTTGQAYIEGLGTISIEEMDELNRWAERFSLSDIQALFSNDVNVIWTAFPGHGILHNNNAYSPEWLFANIERAVYGELIPLHDLERVIDTAENHFGFINEITAEATTTIQAAYS